MSLRNWFSGSLSLVFVVLTTNPLLSQSINSGTVSGTVLDPDQMVVPHALIELRNAVTGYSQTATTDDTGAFRFNNVPQNMYEVKRHRSGLCGETTAGRGAELGTDQFELHSPDGRGSHHSGRKRVAGVDRHRSLGAYGHEFLGIHEAAEHSTPRPG